MADSGQEPRIRRLVTTKRLDTDSDTGPGPGLRLRLGVSGYPSHDLIPTRRRRGLSVGSTGGLPA